METAERAHNITGVLIEVLKVNTQLEFIFLNSDVGFTEITLAQHQAKRIEREAETA